MCKLFDKDFLIEKKLLMEEFVEIVSKIEKINVNVL
jgi:hypothetical protein